MMVIFLKLNIGHENCNQIFRGVIYFHIKRVRFIIFAGISAWISDSSDRVMSKELFSLRNNLRHPHRNVKPHHSRIKQQYFGLFECYREREYSVEHTPNQSRSNQTLVNRHRSNVPRCSVLYVCKWSTLTVLTKELLISVVEYTNNWTHMH